MPPECTPNRTSARNCICSTTDFQHRRLARDFDIVLLTPADVRDSLLPVGRLREPLSSLARADAVVLSGNLPPESVPEFVKRRWRVQRSIFAPHHQGRVRGLLRHRAAGAVLLAAAAGRIEHRGDATRFAITMRTTADDIQKLLRLRDLNRASAFVTTEKDAVNLGEQLRELGTVHVVPLRMELEDADAALNELLARIAERKSRPA